MLDPVESICLINKNTTQVRTVADSVNPPFQLLIKANGLQINVHLSEHHVHCEGLWIAN